MGILMEFYLDEHKSTVIEANGSIIQSTDISGNYPLTFHKNVFVSHSGIETASPVTLKMNGYLFLLSDCVYFIHASFRIL